MDRRSVSTPQSASGLAPRDRANLPAPAGIALLIDDSGLAAALRTQLRSMPGLTEAGAESASVFVADHPLAEASEAPHPVLLVGTDRPPRAGENFVASLEPRLILAAAAVVAAGHRVEPADHPRRYAHEPSMSRLSQRERQVAALLAEGASNKLIARRLGISVHTAKFHVGAVLEKLGAHNRADAVAIALREGLVVV